MSSPGYAVFCATGHLVKLVGHSEIDYTEVNMCPYCKSKEFYTQLEWGDDDYEQFVPSQIIGRKNKVVIYDINKLKKNND